MSAQAGVVSSSQVTVPNGPTSSMSKPNLSAPNTWAWVWFVFSLLFLIVSYMGGMRRGRG